MPTVTSLTALTALLAPAALLIGLTVGLFGGGGAILAVPVFRYLAGVDAHSAVGASLIIVAASSLFGLALRRRSGVVQWRLGLILALGGIAGTQFGHLAAGWVSERTIVLVFATVMLASALSQLLPLSTQPPSPPHTASPRLTRHSSPGVGPGLLTLLAAGAGVGMLTGFTGAGGGFILVPLLLFLAELSFAQAVGTSLFIMALNSSSGAISFLLSPTARADLDLRLVAGVLLIAMLGTALGTRWAHRLPQARAKRLFGVFVFLVGSAILAHELFA